MPRVIGTAYLIAAVIAGATMIFLSPPFQAPDEVNHFYRAWTLAEGRFFASREGNLIGAPVRVAVWRWVTALVDEIPAHPEKKQSVSSLASLRDADATDPAVIFIDFRNTALYSPVAYVPQAIGLGLGRLLRWPLLDTYYVARLLNLLSSVALCWWAASQLPYGRLSFVLIALCPMFLFQQASLSADGLTFGLTAAFCAAVLHVVRAGDRVHLDTRAVVKLAVLGALMALTKPSAAPVPLFALLLLGCRAGVPARRPWPGTLTMIGVAWAAMLAWSLAVRHLYVPSHPFVAVDPEAQLAYVLANSLRVAAVLRDTIAAYWYPFYLSAVGVLGWLDTPLSPRYINYFYLVLIASALVPSSPPVAAARRERALAAFIILATIALLLGIMYLTWTAVGAPIVEGMQGRYVLPLAVLWAVLMQWPAAAQRRVGPRAASALTVACLLYAVVFLGHAFRALLLRYWA
jgi:uncharacterized membrane protein